MINQAKKFFLITIFLLSNTIFAYHGGGVLPYAINPKNKEVYFLFSKEAFGKYKGQWSDFGGKADRKDRNHATWIAAREFTEESNNLFGRYGEVQRHLNRRYPNTFRISNGYAIFLTQVQFDKNINKIFQRRLARARHIHNREKSELIWVNAKRLEKALLTNNRNIRLRSGKVITLRNSALSFLRKRALPIIKKIKKKQFGRAPVLKING